MASSHVRELPPTAVMSQDLFQEPSVASQGGLTLGRSQKCQDNSKNLGPLLGIQCMVVHEVDSTEANMDDHFKIMGSPGFLENCVDFLSKDQPLTDEERTDELLYSNARGQTLVQLFCRVESGVPVDQYEDALDKVIERYRLELTVKKRTPSEAYAVCVDTFPECIRLSCTYPNLYKKPMTYAEDPETQLLIKFPKQRLYPSRETMLLSLLEDDCNNNAKEEPCDGAKKDGRGRGRGRGNASPGKQQNPGHKSPVKRVRSDDNKGSGSGAQDTTGGGGGSEEEDDNENRKGPSDKTTSHSSSSDTNESHSGTPKKKRKKGGKKLAKQEKNEMQELVAKLKEKSDARKMKATAALKKKPVATTAPSTSAGVVHTSAEAGSSDESDKNDEEGDKCCDDCKCYENSREAMLQDLKKLSQRELTHRAMIHQHRWATTLQTRQFKIIDQLNNMVDYLKKVDSKLDKNTEYSRQAANEKEFEEEQKKVVHSLKLPFYTDAALRDALKKKRSDFEELCYGVYAGEEGKNFIKNYLERIFHITLQCRYFPTHSKLKFDCDGNYFQMGVQCFLFPRTLQEIMGSFLARKYGDKVWSQHKFDRELKKIVHDDRKDYMIQIKNYMLRLKKEGKVDMEVFQALWWAFEKKIRIFHSPAPIWPINSNEERQHWFEEYREKFNSEMKKKKNSNWLREGFPGFKPYKYGVRAGLAKMAHPEPQFDLDWVPSSEEELLQPEEVLQAKEDTTESSEESE